MLLTTNVHWSVCAQHQCVYTHYYTYLSAAYVDMFVQAGHLCYVHWSVCAQHQCVVSQSQCTAHYKCALVCVCTIPVVWVYGNAGHPSLLCMLDCMSAGGM